MNTKSNLNRFVYELIYPAILGSVLYSILPLQSTSKYYLGLSILLFYIMDYIHLYFVMGDKFSVEQQNGKIYILFDLLVSIVLFISFSYLGITNENQIINEYAVIIPFILIPFFFLAYSKVLKYNVKYYTSMCILGVVLGIISLMKIEIIKLYSIEIIIYPTTLIYTLYVFLQLKKIDK